MSPVPERIYLDHAATTPVRPEVLAEMEPYFARLGYNPSSLHAEGRAARAGLDRARERVAAVLGTRPREIVFTGGGTEADNLALLGVARAADAAGGRRRHVVATALEHHAVLHPLEQLRDEGWDVTLVEVDRDGLVDPARFAAALREETLLASVMLANNEIGTVEPVATLAELARARGVLFHTDAVQAPGKLALGVDALGVDLLTLTAHKFYGPKGIGVLYVRDGTPLAPVVLGGGQERGLRSGTENVAGAVGFAAALELAEAERAGYVAEIGGLRDALQARLAALPETTVNGGGAPRLPNNLSVGFAGVEAETLLIRLDLEGIASSAGSACAAGSVRLSHVLEAIGLPERYARGTLRFSLGRGLTREAIEAAGTRITRAVAEIRETAPV